MITKNKRIRPISLLRTSQSKWTNMIDLKHGELSGVLNSSRVSDPDPISGCVVVVVVVVAVVVVAVVIIPALFDLFNNTYQIFTMH